MSVYFTAAGRPRGQARRYVLEKTKSRNQARELLVSKVDWKRTGVLFEGRSSYVPGIVMRTVFAGLASVVVSTGPAFATGN